MNKKIFDCTVPVDMAQVAPWLDTQKDKYIAQGHIGTHLDIYNKSQIPMEYFQSKGVLIDVSAIGASREIQPEDFADIAIPENSFVFIRTARMEQHRYGTTEYFQDHPQLSETAIDALIEKKIRFIGIDCAGIRRGTQHEPADRKCEQNGIYVIENLCGLDRLCGQDSIEVYTLWFDDERATGLKCRVLAVV